MDAPYAWAVSKFLFENCHWTIGTSKINSLFCIIDAPSDLSLNPQNPFFHSLYPPQNPQASNPSHPYFY